MPGQVRVGKCTYNGGRRIDPKYDGFKNIIVLMKGHSKWGALGPYELKNESGQIMENIWQASKVYPKVPSVCERYSRYNPTIIWKHPAEKHVNDDGTLSEEYKKWRHQLFNNPYAVRYPVGFHNRHTCIYSLKELDGHKLDYIEARKQIYLPTYIELVKQHPLFKELRKLLETENLLIIEVDGPHQESLTYYKQKYNVADDFIENNSVDVSVDNMMILLEDSKHPFGHGYCLGIALLGLEKYIIQ